MANTSGGHQVDGWGYGVRRMLISRLRTDGSTLRPRQSRPHLLIVALIASLLSVAPASGANDKADCGPGDRPETGLQGQISREEQLAGFEGFRCGLRLVGQNTINDRGGNHQLATLGDCAYYTTTALAGANPVYHDTGMAVIDASKPRNPELVDVIRTTGTLETLEALHAYNGIIVAASGNVMDVFDARKDCRKPVLKSSFTLPMATHGFRLSDDGKTAYALGHGPDSWDDGNFNRYLMAVDISNPSKPKTILQYGAHGAHDMDLSPDGNRAYLAGEGGLVILDTSDVQSRKKNPEIREVSKLTWPAGLSITSHTAKWVLIKGKPFILASNEAFKTTCDGRPQARHIDISNERKPVVVAEYGLEVNDADLCNKHNLMADGLSYNVHYIGVDNKFDARVVFWNWFASGVRVFDLAKPTKPREIAYYSPPVKTDVAQKGGLFGEELQWVDLVTPYMWFKPETGHLWIGSANNGFQILEFTARARRIHDLPWPRRKGERNVYGGGSSTTTVRYGPVAAAPGAGTADAGQASPFGLGGWCTLTSGAEQRAEPTRDALRRSSGTAR